MSLQARTETGAARRTTTRTQDAVGLLLADHRAVKKLFGAYQDLMKARANRGTKSEKANLVQQICLELSVHAQIEEEIFYPAARKAIKDNELMDEAVVEHASLKDLIAQLAEMDPGDELYDAKVVVLSDYFEHHIREEEKQMFPRAKKTRLDLETLGEQLQKRKIALTRRLAAATAKNRRH